MDQEFKPIIQSAAKSTSTRDEDKLFQAGLADFPEDVAGRLQKLMHDLDDIESGRVNLKLPNYPEDGKNVSSVSTDSKHGDGAKKKISWTEEEHRKFLEGLVKCCKGNWRGNSRSSVVQVARDACNDDFRQASTSKNEKRPSIHDSGIITDAPIDGATTATAAAATTTTTCGD